MRTRSTHSASEETTSVVASEKQLAKKITEEIRETDDLEELPVEKENNDTAMSPIDPRPKSVVCDVAPTLVTGEGAVNSPDEAHKDTTADLPDAVFECTAKHYEAEDKEASDSIVAESEEEIPENKDAITTMGHERGRSASPESSGVIDQKSIGEKASSGDSKKHNDKVTTERKTPSSSVNPFSMFPPFPANPASFFSGPLPTEIAKSFYNSLTLLASQAMLNVKQEPKESDAGTSTENQLQVPPRNDSSSSNLSASSNDGQKRYRGGPSYRERSPVPSSKNEMLRSLSGLSPASLAEQLRNNDSASMVVSRQQKFSSRNQVYQGQGFPRAPYPNSGEGSPPPSFPPMTSRESPPRSSDFPAASHGGMSSSPSLHHFTTRYTIETPADPSRLGVELVLDHDNNEPVIEVECGGNRGLLYVNKLCQGSKGQSVHFNDEWLTPNEFQFISGRETAKDWKRSIRHCGKSLKTLMTKGILQVHPPVCECSQCRGTHSGSKLLCGKKTPLKDNNKSFVNRIKPSPPFAIDTDGNHSDADGMTRHGLEGGLNSIISQLHKANGFDGNEVGETLDLSAKSHERNETSSPEVNSRKRSRDESPEMRKPKVEADDGRNSPAPKRPYSRQDEYHRSAIDPSSFAASYAFMSPEEQYRRMLALMSRSLTPEEQQRQILALAQNMADPMRMPANFPDLPGLASALQASAMYNERSKSKYKEGRDSSEDSSHAYDLTRRMGRKPGESSSRRSGYGFTPPDNYRKPDRQSGTPSRGESNSKYIALESRNNKDRSDHPNRDDIRSWTASRHAAMIDLNSSGSSHSRGHEWTPKAPWPNERGENRGKHGDVKSSPSRNGTYSGYFQDNIVLDRIPISKTPVTTLHHRPSSNHTSDSDANRRHRAYPGDNHRANHKNENGTSRNMPMLDLQKHAVPMLSLKRPTQDDLFGSPKERDLGKRLSNNSDQEMKDINENSMRQSSSAPPPHFSPQESNRDSRRPTSAQDRLHPALLHTSRRNVASPTNSSRRHMSSSACDVMEISSCHNYLQKKDKAVQQAFDEMQKWNTEDACKFIEKIDPSLKEHMEDFRKHEIDGEGLPFLTDRHLTEMMDIKLGIALKIIARIRRALKILPESLTCNRYFLQSTQVTKSDSKASENDHSPKISPESKEESKAVPNSEENNSEEKE